MVRPLCEKLENGPEMLSQSEGTLTQPVVYDLSDDD